ncbi:MAG: CHASE2 domain-containing protein, partial [Hyphomicrobiales bacterium]
MLSKISKATLAPISGIFALCAVLFVQLAQPGFIETFSLSVFDSFQRIKPRELLDSPVRIIDIDEKSLKTRGQWPWPRTDVATMVERLGEMGAAAIAFDIVFSEPDRTSPVRILEQLRKNGVVAETLTTHGPLDNDEAFANTLKNWPVVAGMVLLHEPNENKALVKSGIAIAGADPRNSLVEYGGIVGNLPALEEAAKGVGYFSFEPDRFDRTVRRLPVIAKRGDDIHPSLVAESLRVAQQAGTIILKSSDASGELDWGESVSMVAAKIGDVEIPTNEAGEIWIYHAGHQPQRFISAHKLLGATGDELEKMRPLIEGHIVLIGASAAGLLDIVSTPISSSTAGVEVQAEALEMVLGGQYLHRPDWARGLELTATVLFSLLLIVLMPAIGPLWCAVLGGIVVATCIGGAWVAFSQYS